jgi:hypothetical protein
MDRRDVHGLEGFRFDVGLSSIIGVTVQPGQIASVFKHFSGGSLEIVNGSTTSPWGLGYLFATNEAVQIDSSTTVYFAASGATVTVMGLRGRSSGFEDV